jgi:TAG lipase/steryl ester hydrolase/phospholipase A2/LPA acyltransferase
MLQGHNLWKETFESIESDYNPEVIRANMLKLQEAADCCDIVGMLHLIRTTLTRDLGGMNMLRLYKHSWFGTKSLISDYIETAVGTIEKFQKVTEGSNFTTTESQYYQSSLEDALRYFGRSALTLSGGANLGMKHIGVVKALWEAELLPDIISGASAGSIVAAICCTATDKEMAKVLERFPTSDLAVFDSPGTEGLYWFKERINHAWETRAFYAIKNLERVMKSWLRDLTFREAHNKTGRTLNICISSFESSEPRLLNYVTAPDVYIWSAVCASCSVPFVFQPATIYEKDPKTGQSKVWMLHSQQWVDGSLDHDIPMRKLSEMFNVNFFIVSQVNPHVRLFLETEEQFNGVQPTSDVSSRGKFRTGMTLVNEEMIYRAQMMTDWGLPRLLTRGVSVFNQQYTGDINILPKIEPSDYMFMMANPSPEFMLRSTRIGERATWPKMCRIKNSVAIEKALIRAINEFRDRVNFGPEAAKARQPVDGSNRGRSRTAGRKRPSFLRRRSLSNETSNNLRPGLGRGSGPPSPSPNRGIKRNSSVGSIMEGLWLGLTPVVTKPSILTPQAGVSNALTMLTPTTSDSFNLTRTNNQRAPAFSFALDDESDTESEETVMSPDGRGTSIQGDSAPEPPSSPIQSLKNFFGRPH